MTNKNSCRACLECKPKMVSLFEPYRSFTIAHFITSLTDIKITKSQKNFPKHLCSVCLEELEVVLNFKKKCKDTDKYLKSLSQIPAEPCDTAEVKKEATDEVKFEEADELYAFDCEFDNEYLGEAEESDKEKLDVDLIKTEVNVSESELDRKSLADGDKLDVDVLKPDLNSKEILKREPTFGTYFECHDCGERFRSKCKLRVHWKKTHNYFTCENCKKAFKLYHSFKMHSLKACINPNIVRVVFNGKKRHFYCKCCDYETSYCNTMRIHSARHTGERAYACDICGKTYTQLSSVIDHKERIHQQYRVEMTCDHCGKHIKGRSKWHKHLILHLNATFQCDICDTVMKRKQSLEEHMKRHFGKKNIPATCEICGKVFASSSHVQVHKKSVHVTTPYWCKMCKYQNKNIYALRKHERCHNRANMVQCSHCYRFFDGQEKINRHMHVYHGPKSHICVFCDRGFAKRYTLTHHQSLMHAKELPNHTGPTYIRLSRQGRRKK